MEITDYVDFKTALALKKAGFNEPCDSYYIKDNAPDGTAWIVPTTDREDFNADSDCPFCKPLCSAPTLAQAQKWLREKKEIFVEVTSEALHDWDFFVMELDKDANIGVVRGSEIYPSYEQALSAGIKSCVEFLLK